MRIPRVPTYLVKGLNSRYYFRIIVPLDVRQALGGQREFRRALGTTDKRKAISLAWGMAAEYQTLFERCRMGKDPNDPLKDSVLSTELLVERKISPDGTVTEKITFDDPDVQKDKERLEAYEKLQRKKESQPFKHSVRDNVSGKSDPEVTTSNNRRARRNKGQKSSEFETLSAEQTTPLMLSGLVERYAEEKEATGSWSSNTKKENESSYDKLVKFVGDQPIDAVTRKDANRLLKLLKKMPSKKGGTLSVSGINKKMGMMSSLYIYAKDHELTTKNPFKKLQLTVDTLPEDAQDAYTLDELKALFDPTYFKIDPKRPSRYWIPLIMALGGGCRPGELAQLTEEDIVEIDGISCIYINDLMQRKSKNAIRTIPITDKLIDIGFLRFVEQRRQELNSNKKLTDKRLFRELNPNRSKKAGAVSSWWNETHHKHCKVIRTTQVKLGRVTKDRHVSLYSLRHNVQTIFREKGVRETIAAEIVGHEKGSTTGYKVYAKKGQLKPVMEALGKLDYGDALANVPIWA